MKSTHTFCAVGTFVRRRTVARETINFVDTGAVVLARVASTFVNVWKQTHKIKQMYTNA